MSLPTQYKWLNDLSPLPKMVSQGLKLLGTLEGPGVKNNPTILAWAKETATPGYSADEIPWCGLFMAVIAKRAGKPIPHAPLWALNWSNFGVNPGQPALGDILTFIRPGGGHVALYIAEDTTAYHVLGGNQSNQVSITRIDKHRLHSVRRPAYNVQPATVKPYVVAASGKLSDNEA